MRTSLIITTYNRPDALWLVLRSALAQSVLPDEIIVADDGSDHRTEEVIAALQAESPIPLHHVWQEDQGFRAARIRNKGASKATGDYLVFIDGDMVLQRAFIHAHINQAKTGYFLHGKRAMLSEWRTATVLRQGQNRISPWLPGIGLWTYSFQSEALARVFSYDSRDWHDTQSANLSLWKSDLLKVNGFNEDFKGWGLEDSELALRLIRSGLVKRELRFCAVAFHLGHGKDNKLRDAMRTAQNQLLLEEVEKSGVTICEHGIRQH